MPGTGLRGAIVNGEGVYFIFNWLADFPGYELAMDNALPRSLSAQRNLHMDGRTRTRHFCYHSHRYMR